MDHISSRKKYLDVARMDYLEPLLFLRLTCCYRRQRQMQMKVSKSETYCSVGETKRQRVLGWGNMAHLLTFSSLLGPNKRKDFEMLKREVSCI